MARQFDHANGTVLVVARNPQLPGADLSLERVIEAVVASEDFRLFGLPIDVMCLSALCDQNLLPLSNKRAGQLAD